MKKISYKYIFLILIISILIIGIFCLAIASSMAITSDYSLTDKTVILDGENDGMVEINLVSENGGNFYALDADWTLSEQASSTYFILSDLVAGGSSTPIENNPSTGKVYWTDSTLTGFTIPAKGTIWTAKYTINKDTPEGTYTVKLNVDAITGGTKVYDSDESFSKIATITVKKEEKLPFTDLDTTKWYMPYIKYVYKNNLMTGYTSTTFAPNEKITRGQIVTILYRNSGSPASSYEMNFSDMPASLSEKYYYEPVRWAAENEIVTGYKSGENAGKFMPNDYITREQFALILQRYAKYKNRTANKTADLSGFKDYQNISNYAIDGLKWAVGNGIIKGNGDGTLNPKGNASRAESATMIMRYCEEIN